MIRVLIADDSALMRKMLKRILETDPDIEIAGIARDGIDVVEKAREIRPDVITMDVNMPGMDGITALQYIVNEKICPVIMVSSLTQEGAMTTFESLELGAFDYVGKPGGTVSSNMDVITDELISKVKAAAGLKKRRGIEKLTRSPGEKRQVVKNPPVSNKPVKAVAMGISTGGPKMIYEVLPLIPANINAILFLVQHMPPNFTSTYVKRLNDSCQLEVVEAQAGMKVRPGVVYVGSGGRHLNLVKNASGEVMMRLPSKPDHLFIPSVGVMMESVLSVYGSKTIGVMMTGMGNDGADAMVKIKNAGGITIAEAEESAIVWGMPGEVVKKGGASIVTPIWNIASEIMKAVNK
ncbi:protein-glutamate methylesterase/protein-glutamine glutaminase [Syntrophomonas palmitatica]|uniref:protein-glutamate methylesterase/protein-glutamine glutaminase n=1 Tax=Syntrophomonas palmitatica TaxID=402877 RepID=UPI0006CF6F11|nr:chemotaxis response regulator protein-glutamate methylesterase [Syntrophomonas palmitatica]